MHHKPINIYVILHPLYILLLNIHQNKYNHKVQILYSQLYILLFIHLFHQMLIIIYLYICILIQNIQLCYILYHKDINQINHNIHIFSQYRLYFSCIYLLIYHHNLYMFKYYHYFYQYNKILLNNHPDKHSITDSNYNSVYIVNLKPIN